MTYIPINKTPRENQNTIEMNSVSKTPHGIIIII